MRPISKRLLLVAAATLLVATAACGGSDGADGGGGGGGESLEPVPVGAPADGGADEDTSAGGGAEEPTVSDASGGSTDFGGLSAAATSVRSAVIKTAELELKVPHGDFEERVREAEAIAGTYRGFILESSISEGGKFLSGTVSIRVPSRSFEDALTEMSALGSIRNETTSGQEVSQEFIDLEARLRNWKLQEAVILDLMDRSTTIQDTIRVQSELSAIQLEIEQLQGRLNFLRDQTSFGTITASFVTGAAPAPKKPSPIARAWRQAVDTMEAIGSGLVLSLGVVIPMLVLLGLIWLVIRQFRPKLSN